jgi:hypothetical protein
MAQQELFGIKEPELCSQCKKNLRVSLSALYLSFAFLFAMLVFMAYVLWDFGIAGRVVIFITGILVLVNATMKIVSNLIDRLPWRR